MNNKINEIKYSIKENERIEFENELYIENIMDKLTPKERVALGHYTSKMRRTSLMLGASIMALGSIAIIMELFWLAGI